jgi:hypothetical protein
MKIEKLRFLLIVLIAALALGTLAHAAGKVAPYAHAGIEYTKFHSSASDRWDYFPDWEAGVAVGGGIVIAGYHSIGLEVSYAESRSTVKDVPGFPTKKQQMPVLTTYRYTHAFSDLFSAYGGATAGVMMDKYTMDTGNPMSSGSDTNWVPAAGAIAGVNLSLGRHWYLSGGARVIEVWQEVYRDIGNTGLLHIGEKTNYARTSFTLGVGCKW